MRRLARLLLVLLATLTIACGQASSKPTRLVRVGGTAPTFDVTDIRDANRRVRLTELRGRPVVLNFWASWCVPCRKEMPALESAHRSFGDRVAFLGMNHQDTRGDGLKLLRETGISYPSGFDPEGTVATAYRLFGMPSTVFVSAQGRLVAKKIGEIRRDELVDTVAKLFGIRPGG